MKSGDLVVQNHHPGRRRLIWVGLALVVALAGLALFELGQLQGGYNRTETGDRIDVLQTEIESLTSTKAQLGEEVTRVRRSHEIDKASYKVVREDLKRLQEEILELREEVDFYRGIVSPAERLAGLNIQNFKIFPAGEENLYHFELVLTQVLKNDHTVKGRVKLALQGVQEGEPKVISFKELSPNESVKESFRFRYFQKMEGDIRLPENFVPRTVEVEMSPRKRKQIRKSFLWVVNGGG